MTLKPISSLMGNRKLQPLLNAAKIVNLSQQVVGELGEVLTFRDGTLKLNVASSVAAVKVKMNEEELISKINNRLGVKTVLKIKYKVGK